MKVFIYMNEQIRKPKPTRPVIVLLRGSDLEVVEGNTVVINGPSVVRYDPRGLTFAKDHAVKAWIEADSRDVVIR